MIMSELLGAVIKQRYLPDRIVVVVRPAGSANLQFSRQVDAEELHLFFYEKSLTSCWHCNDLEEQAVADMLMIRNPYWILKKSRNGPFWYKGLRETGWTFQCVFVRCLRLQRVSICSSHPCTQRKQSRILFNTTWCMPEARS